MRLLKLVLLFAVVVCFCAPMLSGQTVTGTLSGRVVDATGAVVPNAKIAVRGEDTGFVRDGKTNDEGYYVFTFIPLGRYTVTATAPGFKIVQKKGVEIFLNTTTDSNFKLELATRSETVQVTGEVPLVETSAADVKNTFETKAIEDRPLPTRNFLYFAETVPGFQENPVSGQNNPTASSGSSVNVNGTGTRGTSFQINGVNNDDSSENQQRQGVNISTIQQVQVLTNNFSSEFGRSYGTIVLVQTKQGTNNFHGDAFWFHNNTYFQARDFFQSAKVYDVYKKVDPATGRSLCTTGDPECYKPYKIPASRRQDYGGTIGGPIIKNKLFFFASVEQVKSGGSASKRVDILLPGEKKLGVPASVTDPKDRAFIQQFMDAFPNAAPNDPTYGPRAYLTSYGFHYPDYDYTGRADWNVSTKTTLSGRYQWTHQRRQAEEVIKGENVLQNNHQQNLGLTLSHIFTNAQTGEFRLGLGRRSTEANLLDAADYPNGNVPIVRFSNANNPGTYVASTIMGNSGVYPIMRYQTDWQFVYNHFWMTTPKLTLKMGTDIRPGQLNDTSDQFSRGYWVMRDQGAPTNPDGTPFTLAQWTADPRCPWSGEEENCPYRDAYWSFLHGMFGSTGADFQKSIGPRDLANNLNEANFYVQGDYKVTPNFTLMLGFRDEWVAAVTERNNKINYGYNSRNNPSPRIGLSYSPGFASQSFLGKLTGGPGKTVLHGGYGMFTGRIFQSFFSQNGASVRFMPPYGISPTWDITAAKYAYVPGFFSDPTKGFTYDHSMPTMRTGPTQIAANLYPPYVEQWNFTLQREVTSTMGVTAAYVGSHGIGLPFYNVLNRSPFPAVAPTGMFANDPWKSWEGVIFDCVDPNILSTSPIKDPVTGHQCISLAQPYTTARRPDPRFSGIMSIRNGNMSWYNAMQLTLKKRMSHGLQFEANYTWGKALDTGSEATYTGLETGAPTTMLGDARLNKGYSLFDTPHRFTLTYSYELPFFRDQKVHVLGEGLAASTLGKVLGGWQLTGAYIFASGTPFGVTAGYDLNADGYNNDRPDLLDASVLGTAVNDAHINPATGLEYAQTQLPQNAFFPNVTTPSGSRVFRPGLTNVGTLGRNTFRSDGRNNLDAALQKNFRITEGSKLVFRWEVYNVANHTQFYLPGGTTSFSTPALSWMKITSTRNNRVDTGTGSRYMQGALRFIF